MTNYDRTVFMFYPRVEFEKFASREFGYAPGINGHFEVALAVENYATVDQMYDDIISKGGDGMVSCFSV